MNLNKVFIIGRLTQDPEVRSTQAGQSVATVKMATNRVWTDKAGQKQEGTEFHTIVAWGRLGEIAGQYLKKGGLAMFEGRLQTRSWVDQNNNKRYTTEIVAESLQMGPRATGSSSGGGFQPRPVPSERQAGGPVMSDVRKSPSPVQDADIPIIGEDEPVSAGVEEDEVKINKEDLPF
ncbi:MAG: single-stranded DNA-binding protein [bacterium]|nr:single-stranded DNA-binding protein [bacterium]